MVLAVLAAALAFTGPVTSRRAVLSSAAAAAIASPALPAFASKFPEHVQDLDKAATSKDVAAVQKALKTLALPSDEATAKRVFTPTGDAKKLTATANFQLKVSSAKVQVSVPESDAVVKYVWLATEDGTHLAVREVKAGEAPGLACSVPNFYFSGKALTVLPVLYSEANGIWRGEPFVLGSDK